MKKINALTIENLRISEEMAYYYFVVMAVATYSIIANKFAQTFALFKAAFDYQDELYKRHDRKLLTQKAQEMETMRDKWFRKLRNNIREVLEFGSGEKLAAAQVLSTIVEEYGGAKIPDMKTEAETGVLINLYEDLQQKYPELVELLSLTPVVEGAKQANLEFIEAQNERLHSDVEYGKGKLDAARPVTAKKYRYFIDSINLEAAVDDNGELNPFIDFMNAKVDEMRKLTGQNPAPAGSGSGSDDELAVKFKTATFKFANGDSIKRQVEVGTVLIAPDNTFGYVWNKEIPELMPNKNLTFHEVSIEEAKATATFHFLDHTEEKITQVVGTPLVAPANTEGCVWQPEVSATMPAEDTAYYEVVAPLPNPDEGNNGENNDNNNENTEGGENNGSNNGENNGEGGDNNGTNKPDPDDPWYNPDDEPD